MKKAHECTNLSEIRGEIDTIDLELIKLIAERGQYVKAAARFKKSPSAVEATERVEQALKQRKAWAVENEISESLISDIFTRMIQFFISDEKREWSTLTTYKTTDG